MDMSTGTFRCEHCSTELRQTFGGGGEMGDEGARRRHVIAMKDLLSRVETQCKPIMDQLARIQGLLLHAMHHTACVFFVDCVFSVDRVLLTVSC